MSEYSILNSEIQTLRLFTESELKGLRQKASQVTDSVSKLSGEVSSLKSHLQAQLSGVHAGLEAQVSELGARVIADTDSASTSMKELFAGLERQLLGGVQAFEESINRFLEEIKKASEG